MQEKPTPTTQRYNYATISHTLFLTLKKTSLFLLTELDIFNLARLPTICQSNTTTERRLTKMAVESPEIALYHKLVDRMFPLKN